MSLDPLELIKNDSLTKSKILFTDDWNSIPIDTSQGLDIFKSNFYVDRNFSGQNLVSDGYFIDFKNIQLGKSEGKIFILKRTMTFKMDEYVAISHSFSNNVALSDSNSIYFIGAGGIPMNENSNLGTELVKNSDFHIVEFDYEGRIESLLFVDFIRKKITFCNRFKFRCKISFSYWQKVHDSTVSLISELDTFSKLKQLESNIWEKCNTPNIRNYPTNLFDYFNFNTINIMRIIRHSQNPTEE